MNHKDYGSFEARVRRIAWAFLVSVILAFVLAALHAVPPPRITITPANPSITVGDTVQLTALSDGTPVMAIWTSGTPSVATINVTGLVTGVAAGSSVITARVGHKKAMTAVTVTAPQSNAEVTVDPGIADRFSVVTVSFSMPNPSASDWISLALPGSAPEALFDWMYTSSCTQTPSTARASGSCPFTVWEPEGTYEFRLFPPNLTIVDTVPIIIRNSQDPCNPTSPRGPQPCVEQPAGSVTIFPGSSIQAAVTANANGTTFWIKQGVHTITSVITPKTGNTFVGEYGAILDASSWITNDTPGDSATRDLAVFRGLNNGVTGVTIKNLIIRDGPEYAINVYLTAANWIVEYCEISGFRNGISFGKGMMVRKNLIHHNAGILDHADFPLRGAGYTGNSALGATMTDNEISYNGQEQKFIYGTTNEPSQNITITSNFVHHNVKDGLWIDGDGAGSVVSNNVCDDNGRTGITIEIGTTVLVQNNIVRRNAEEGILISATRDSTFTGNLVEDNLFGINLFLHFPRLAEQYPFWTIDLSGNVIRDNTIYLSTGDLAALLSFQDAGDQTPYLNNTKNNHFQNNDYFAPNTTSNWFTWNGSKSFTAWQALPQDATGSIAVR